MDYAQRQEAVDKVVELVTRRDHVTIAEIQRLLAPYMPVNGDTALGIDGNVWFAFGVSDELARVMEAVQRDGRVAVEPTNLLVYLGDGCALSTMPIAKRPPRGGYRAPHFAPIVFRPRSAVDAVEEA